MCVYTFFRKMRNKKREFLNGGRFTDMNASGLWRVDRALIRHPMPDVGLKRRSSIVVRPVSLNLPDEISRAVAADRLEEERKRVGVRTMRARARG